MCVLMDSNLPNNLREKMEEPKELNSEHLSGSVETLTVVEIILPFLVVCKYAIGADAATPPRESE